MTVPAFAAISDPYVFWSLAACCALLAGFAKCGISGAGILAVPMMAHIFPAGQSTGILLPMLVVGDVLAVAYYKKHAVWSHVLRALPWAFLGILAGFATVKQLQAIAPDAHVDIILKRMIGGIVLAVLILGYWVQRRKAEHSLHVPTRWWFAALIGLIGGFTTMTANAAGPVFILYFLALQLPKETFLGTSGWTFLILNTVKLPFSHNLGYITTESLLYDAKMIPAIALGAVLGITVIRRLPEHLFSASVKLLAVAAAFKLVLS